MIRARLEGKDIGGILARIQRGVDAAQTAVSQKIADNVVRKLSRDGGGLPSKPGEPPMSQSGRLSQSVGFSKANKGYSRVGLGVFYGKVLEFGRANIKAKKTFMVIPVSDEAKKLARRTSIPAALNRYYMTYRAQIQRIPVKGRGFMLVRVKQGKNNGGSSMTVDWRFVRSVSIRPRPFFRPAIAESKPQVPAVFRRAFINAMKGGR